MTNTRISHSTGGQQELLRRVSAVAKKTIVVLIGGRPLTFETGSCDAGRHQTGTTNLEIPRATAKNGVRSFQNETVCIFHIVYIGTATIIC